ncbi:dihydrofolate reductase family protein [Isoalcanivorax beigongshangi]|uniref:Dihydrofolate reductase family protein n=1 Tax=Isoalcanivorax beigongshangi TaxID=3238810 RepID=A0ABV4AJH9_9GAMM
MGSVFVSVGLSLDGYIAPEGMVMHDPGNQGWGAKWGELMAWALNQRYLRERLKLGAGGETGPVNDLLRHTFERTGAYIMGKRMFEQGEQTWPEDAPFQTPVYVLSHRPRAPWLRPGGTEFHFVDQGPESALALARASAGDADVRISGGADTIQQYLDLDAVDELEIALVPILFGGGRRLFEQRREPLPQFRIDRVIHTAAATHLRYVRR